MKNLIDIKLPEEVLENMPSDKLAMIQYLAKHIDTVIAAYENSFRQRVSGVMAGPLTRFERSMLKDFLMDMALPVALRRALEGSGSYPALSEMQEMAAK